MEELEELNKLVAELNEVTRNRDLVIDMGQTNFSGRVLVNFEDTPSIYITHLGHGKIIDFIIQSSNERINNLKKQISDALYPPSCKN